MNMLTSKLDLRASLQVIAVALISIVASMNVLAGESSAAPDSLDFKSSCAAHYAKRRPDESVASASLWCSCMEATLDSDTKIDFVNVIWLMSLNPEDPASRSRAARILNISPNDITEQGTPAVTAAFQNISARVKGPSDKATEHCRSSLNYKKK